MFVCLKVKHDRFWFNNRTKNKKQSHIILFNSKRTNHLLAKGLCFQIMVTIDELCQLARLGQTAKIQKYLQIHSE